MAKELRHFEVLKRSHINGSIANGGDRVAIEVDPETFRCGDNLKEIEAPVPAAEPEPAPPEDIKSAAAKSGVTK